ncbi:MAG: hypothetical protein AAF074_10890 [Pseudomonadota bacterium]
MAYSDHRAGRRISTLPVAQRAWTAILRVPTILAQSAEQGFAAARTYEELSARSDEALRKAGLTRADIARIVRDRHF